ncbi:MAG: hypothetical protein KDI51_20570, partial [Xanthomonadales bacterium]|nr:hypothetical protein [Xanthomonadales bacterium]
GNHPDRIDGRFSFGRHGLSRTHVDALSREGNTSWQAMREMVHDLNLIAVAAQRSASGTLKNPGDHRRLLAKGIVDTMKVFGLKPTTTPEGIGAVLMRELLAARGDGGSGLQAFQEVVMHQGKNHTPDS